MIEINGKKYRNIQEQVKENMEDIADIKAAMPYPSNEYYTKTEADNKFQEILTTSDSISITDNEISVDEEWLETGFYTKTDSDGRYSKKLYKHDIIFSLADSEDHYAGAHIVIIDEYAQMFKNQGYSYHKYISGLDDAPGILKSFAEGDIQILLSMKCLDEGVDIPRAEHAIFCSSTGNPRQFVQRRGRVLRKSKGKDK